MGEQASERELVSHSVCTEASEQIDLLEPEALATLADRDLELECSKLIRCRLSTLVDRFYDGMPRSLEAWKTGSYQQLVSDFRVGNFGVLGSRLLYSRIGVFEPDEAFQRRACEQIPRLGRMMGEAFVVDGAAFVRTRVLTYAEYTFASPRLHVPLHGAGLHENGRAAEARWLTTVLPPFSPFADRGTCSEFRMLTSLCEALSLADPEGMANDASRREFTGFLKALVSGPCCVSCVGAVAQFVLLFPGINVQLAGGRLPRTV
eukprot:gnl/TRDRNA2_/TRDRNA2_171521_c4_seq1.p1 gnl/TRDRNA2_/TRDRNA2_171521_c4~~gnl/TRDRNA2_/TRDRNA2_171521_c4_seq1.p1  ORF type:complete len:289 (-),score=38.68 gnl/TRDRNA2_/TRDRNA2_171521_c4_seq1:56-841(-)